MHDLWREREWETSIATTQISKSIRSHRTGPTAVWHRLLDTRKRVKTIWRTLTWNRRAQIVWSGVIVGGQMAKSL